MKGKDNKNETKTNKKAPGFGILASPEVAGRQAGNCQCVHVSTLSMDWREAKGIEYSST